MKLERLRKFNTRDVYPQQQLDNDMCMVVKAGNRIFLRGQTGLDLQQRLVSEHAAAQAEQAMQNVKHAARRSRLEPRTHLQSDHLHYRPGVS